MKGEVQLGYWKLGGRNLQEHFYEVVELVEIERKVVVGELGFVELGSVLVALVSGVELVGELEIVE